MSREHGPGRSCALASSGPSRPWARAFAWPGETPLSTRPCGRERSTRRSSTASCCGWSTGSCCCSWPRTSGWARTRTCFIPPDSTLEARRRYAQYYSLGRLRKLASQRRGTAHPDLYQSLKVLFEKLRAGYAPLAIPGLGSFLFSPETTPHLDSACLANEHLLEAIRHICYTEDVSGRGGSVLRPVDFGNLGSEELGSVYESLLELHPRIDTDEGPFVLAVAAGHERKTTGSYYTPTSLINCLLDSALDPVVREALASRSPKRPCST